MATSECAHCEKTYDVEDAGYRALCKSCQLERSEHKQVMSDFNFYVDEEMKDVIDTLNHFGFETNNSCQHQSNNDCAWICFDSHDEVLNLMALISRESRELFEYLQAATWDLVIYDDEDDEDITSSVSLRFPASDLKWVSEDIISCLRSACT